MLSKIVQFLDFIERSLSQEVRNGQRISLAKKSTTSFDFVQPDNHIYPQQGNFSRVIIVSKGNGIYEMESGRFVAVAADGNARNDRATPWSLSPPRTFLESPEEFAECRRRSSFSPAGVSGCRSIRGRKLFETEKLDIRCASGHVNFPFAKEAAGGSAGGNRDEKNERTGKEKAIWYMEG